MIPAIALLGISRARRVRLPLPIFLLWPFYFLAWLGVGVAYLLFWVVRGDIRRPARAGFALAMLAHLSGTVVDVHSTDGTRVYLRLI